MSPTGPVSDELSGLSDNVRELRRGSSGRDRRDVAARRPRRLVREQIDGTTGR